MAGNATLSKRNRNSADEFYTALTDIEAELRHYRGYFQGKVVFCNCDDPYESNFFKYFAMNFNHLGLKKLIATSYAGSPVTGEQVPLFEVEGLRATRPLRDVYKVEITEVPDLNEDGAIDLLDVEHLLRHDANVVTPLQGDGDFASPECLALLDEADVVVTNPPWSLIADFLTLIAERGKKFLVLGDQNHLTYEGVFRLITAGQLWVGFNNGGTKWFRVPDDYEIKTEARKKIVDGVKYFSMGRAWWFTNLEAARRNDYLTLYKRYTPEEYPTYTNYPDAIHVEEYTEIPLDYDGEMGVPLTFLRVYNPEQFEILGNSKSHGQAMANYAEKGTYTQGGMRFYLPKGDGTHKRLYDRLIIKRIGAAS
jgi:hypothetical protein